MKVLLICQFYGDLDVSEDYMPYFRSLQENTIKGFVTVSIWGGQTPNSEWEFLTNNSMAFMPYMTIPYQQFIREESPSLANVLKAQGYTANVIHPWNGSGYRRNTVYPLLGFDSFKSIEDFNYEDFEYIRTYPTDLSIYKQLINQYEKRDPDKNFFNFTITMQNHSGYDLPGLESTIFVGDDHKYPRLEQYLTLLKDSDDSLKYLIDYFNMVVN